MYFLICTFIEFKTGDLWDFPSVWPSSLCLLRARTLCLSRTSTCPTWICPPGWLTGTTVCRASWAARAKSWAASKLLSPFTPTKPTLKTDGRFQVFSLFAQKNEKIGKQKQELHKVLRLINLTGVRLQWEKQDGKHISHFIHELVGGSNVVVTEFLHFTCLQHSCCSFSSLTGERFWENKSKKWYKNPFVKIHLSLQAAFISFFMNRNCFTLPAAANHGAIW